MAPRLLGDDAAESVILTRLTIAQCGPPTKPEGGFIWRYPCGLAVAVTLADMRHPVRKALNAARNQHHVHHREGHKADGDWGIVVRRRGGQFDGRCDHARVMA